MAEELNIVNGGDDNRTAENDSIPDGEDGLAVERDGKASERDHKIEVLEQEKSELISENEKFKDQIKVLLEEIDGFRRNEEEMNRRVAELKVDYERYEEDKKALSVIAVQAAKLEGEVFRLQSDLITAMTESEATAAELQAVKSEFESLKKRYEKKQLKVLNLKQEIARLLVGIDKEAEKARAALIDSEMRTRYSEANVLVIEELKMENFRLQNEKKENEAVISSLNEALNDLRGEFHLMKEKAARLENELEGSQKMGREFKERDLKMDNASNVKGLGGLDFPWPVALVSAGTVAAAAAVVIYIGYSKLR